MDILTKKPHESAFFTHAQSCNGWIDSNLILLIDSLGEHSVTFETVSKLVHGFGRDWCANFILSHLTLALASNAAYCAAVHMHDKDTKDHTYGEALLPDLLQW